MKPVKLSLILVIAFIFVAADDITDQIGLAFKAGNAEEIVKHCRNNVDLTILETNDLYTKAEAKQKLNDFFDANPPKDFRILHRGKSKSGLEYAIGTLITENTQFRVSFYIKTEDGKSLIQQLMIDAVQ